jgi:hypothetical protein
VDLIPCFASLISVLTAGQKLIRAGNVEEGKGIGVALRFVRDITLRTKHRDKGDAIEEELSPYHYSKSLDGQAIRGSGKLPWVKISHTRVECGVQPITTVLTMAQNGLSKYQV